MAFRRFLASLLALIMLTSMSSCALAEEALEDLQSRVYDLEDLPSADEAIDADASGVAVSDFFEESVPELETFSLSPNTDISDAASDEALDQGPADADGAPSDGQTPDEQLPSEASSEATASEAPLSDGPGESAEAGDALDPELIDPELIDAEYEAKAAPKVKVVDLKITASLNAKNALTFNASPSVTAKEPIRLNVGDTLRVTLTGADTVTWNSGNKKVIPPEKLSVSGDVATITPVAANKSAVKVTAKIKIGKKSGSFAIPILITDPYLASAIAFKGMPEFLAVGKELDLSRCISVTPSYAYTESGTYLTYKVSGAAKLTAKNGTKIIGSQGGTTAKPKYATITVSSKQNNKVKATYKLPVLANKLEILTKKQKPTKSDIAGLGGMWTLWPMSVEVLSKGGIQAQFYLLNGSDQKGFRIDGMNLSLYQGEKLIAKQYFNNMKVSASKGGSSVLKLTFPAASIVNSDFFLPDSSLGEVRFDVDLNSEFKMVGGSAKAPTRLEYLPTVFPGGHRRIPVSKVSIEEDDLVLAKGDSCTLTATVEPADATNPDLRWTTSNKSVATVENGIIKAVGLGTATITAQATDGSKASDTCEVTVVDEADSDDSLKMRYSTTNVMLGDRLGLFSWVDCDDFFLLFDLKWSSSNNKVATVDSDGNVTAVSLGTATITARATDGSGRHADCVIVVYDPYTPITQVDYNIDTLRYSIEVDEQYAPDLNIEPADGTLNMLDWSSSNPDVATVKNGVITGISEGKTTITVASRYTGSYSESSFTLIVRPMNSEDPGKYTVVFLDFGSSGSAQFVDCVLRLSGTETKKGYVIPTHVALKPGSLLYLENLNQLIKVKSIIDMSSGSYTIEKDEDVSLLDFYSYIDFDGVLEIPSEYALESRGDIGGEMGYTAHVDVADKTTGVSVEGDLKILIHATVELINYQDGDYYYQTDIYLDLDSKVGITSSKEYEKEWVAPVVKIPPTLTPIWGVFLSGEIGWGIDFNAKASFTVSLEDHSRIGYSYNTRSVGSPILEHSTTPSIKLNGEASLSTGPKINIMLSGMGMLNATLSGFGGVRLKATTEDDAGSPTNPDYIHDCTVCVSGSLIPFAEVSEKLELKIPFQNDLEANLELATLEGDPIWEGYWSFMNPKDSLLGGKVSKGEGKCPNCRHRVDITVLDPLGDRTDIYDVRVMQSGKVVDSGVGLSKTYLYPGTYTAQIEVPELVKQTFEVVDRPLNVVLNIRHVIGFVTDTVTGKPLPGVDVILWGFGTETTDEEGYYRFIGVQDGEYTFSFSKNGYHTYERSVKIDRYTYNPLKDSIDAALRPTGRIAFWEELSGGVISRVNSQTINRYGAYLDYEGNYDDIHRIAWYVTPHPEDEPIICILPYVTLKDSRSGGAMYFVGYQGLDEDILADAYTTRGLNRYELSKIATIKNKAVYTFNPSVMSDYGPIIALNCKDANGKYLHSHLTKYGSSSSRIFFSESEALNYVLGE